MEEKTGATSRPYYSDKKETTTDLDSGRRDCNEVNINSNLEEGKVVVGGGGGDHGLNSKSDTVFVAVGKEIKKSKSTLVWAIQHATASGRDKKISILHVHKPVDTTISILGAKFPISKLSEREVKARKEKEKREVAKLIDEYHRICTKAGIVPDKPALIEMKSIEKGIVELIKQFGICKLVMGAASDRHYSQSRKMTQPKSRKAIHVMQQAAETCHIWFVCKGRLIHTRDGGGGGSISNTMIISQSGRSIMSVPPTVLTNSQRWYSESSGMSTPRSLSLSAAGDSYSSSISAISYYDEIDRSSVATGCSSDGSFRLTKKGIVIEEVNEDECESGKMVMVTNDPSTSSGYYDEDCRKVAADASLMKAQMYEKLEEAMGKVEASKREAIEEATKRKKAEETVLELNHKMKLIERSYFEELRRRKEVEYELLKSKERVGSLMRERDEMADKVKFLMEEKLILVTRVERSDIVMKEMGKQVSSVFDFLKQYRN